MQFFLPPRLDPLHESSVTKNTLDRYRRAVHKFDSFLHSEHATPGTAAELDSWLVRYRQASQLTRSRFEQTVAALEFFSPGLKGQLGYSKRVIRGLVKQTPVQHAIPLTSQVAKYMAMCMARVKLFRIAVGMLVQVATGLRPCEMLNLRQKHVMEPTAAIRRFVLRLGANVGTKVQREQVTFLDWDKDVDISKLFLRVLRATPGEEQLFPCSYGQYRRILAHFCAPLGVRCLTPGVQDSRRKPPFKVWTPLSYAVWAGGNRRPVFKCTLMLSLRLRWKSRTVHELWPPTSGRRWSSFENISH